MTWNSVPVAVCKECGGSGIRLRIAWRGMQMIYKPYSCEVGTVVLGVCRDMQNIQLITDKGIPITPNGIEGRGALGLKFAL